MGGRAEDPNKLVTIACRVPAHVRDKFAGLALINGDIRVSRRLERLVMTDIESAQNSSHWPSSKAFSPEEKSPFMSASGEDDEQAPPSVPSPF